MEKLALEGRPMAPDTEGKADVDASISPVGLRSLSATGRYNENYGPNVTQILVQGSRIIRGTVPRAVRAELQLAVKDGVLGRLKKDGLKPEIFFHPDHKHGAAERQKNEAMYAIGCISKVVAHGSERAAYDFEQVVDANCRREATATPAESADAAHPQSISTQAPQGATTETTPQSSTSPAPMMEEV